MITFHKDLLSINPAYNDSIVEYSTSLTGVTYSDVIVSSIPFRVYPINNIFNFNFREIAKVQINQNNFNDLIIPDLTVASIYDDTTLSTKLSPTFIIYTETSADTITKEYKFTKNVEQLINYKVKSSFLNDVRLMLPTNNYLDYFLPYFEGYPTDFAINGLISGDTYQFNNITSISVSDLYSATTSNVQRFYISDGSITNDNSLGLSTTTNLVELYVNSVLKANLRIKRFESRCGVYLKWFNDAGSYSYWLFDEVFNESHTFKTIDEINGVYDNLQNINATSNITGKSGSSKLKLKTSFTDEEKAYISSIISSPKVEMYVHNSPFNQTDEYKFIGVKVNDGAFPFDNKTTNHKMEITITLPDLFTQTL